MTKESETKAEPQVDESALDKEAEAAEIAKITEKINSENGPIVETPPADDKVPAKEEEAVSDDDSGDEDWVTTEDMVELIASVGYSEEDAAEFESKEEFERHVRFMDRDRRIRPGDEQDLALQADEVSRQKQTRSKKAEEQYREDGRFAKAPEELPELDPEEFDERLVEAYKAQSEKIAALEAQLSGTVQNRHLENFHEIVDGLDPELLGNSESLSPKEEELREKLFEEYVEFFNQQEARGKDVHSKSARRAIAKRAYFLTFADEIKKKTRRELTSKAKRQAKKITGSGSRKDDTEFDGDPLDNPNLKRIYNAMLSENE